MTIPEKFALVCVVVHVCVLAETDALIPTFFSPLYGQEHIWMMFILMLQHMVVLFEFRIEFLV